MPIDGLNILLGFLEGLALIVSPCILPILPIILSGSLEGSKKRPIGIIIGFILTFALFTFFSREIVQYTGIHLIWVRYISYAILLLLGVVMVSTYLSQQFSVVTARVERMGSFLMGNPNTKGRFMDGVFFGGLVGLIWTPCAGPILAAVIVQTVLQKSTLSSFLIILAFGVGSAVPMVIIAFFGRSVMNRFVFFKRQAGLVRKGLGMMIIASVVYMVLSEGVTYRPSFANTENKQTRVVNGVMAPYPAPDFLQIAAWINSSPLSIQQLKNKVVLIDFWTYSCINCVRVIPYLNEWYQKYHSKGLVIVGVHAPEFEFEHDLSNVKRAVAEYQIHYPVALDNQFGTWQGYQNQYWPAHYLIDKNGYVVYQHFGEGEYDVTENNIRYLLGINAGSQPSTAMAINADQTPETYLGTAHRARWANTETSDHAAIEAYQYPIELKDNQWALQGAWESEAEKIISTQKESALKIHFNARKVYAVMGSRTGKPILVQILLNGEKVVSGKGRSVVDSAITVNQHTLYEIISLNQFSNGILQLTASDPGLEVYTFTFG